jgi:hypothetical protein
MAIHGDLAQVARERALKRFAEGSSPCSSPPTSPPAASTSTTSARSSTTSPPGRQGLPAPQRPHGPRRARRLGVTLAEYNQHTQVRILQRALRLDVGPPVEVFSQQPEAPRTSPSSRPTEFPGLRTKRSRRSQAGRCCSNAVISSAWVQVMPTVVEAVAGTCAGLRVHRERLGDAGGGTSTRSRSTSTVISVAGSALDRRQIATNGGLGNDHRDEAVLGAVVAEDVAEAPERSRLEPSLQDRPHGVLTRRADPEARPGDQNRRPDIGFVVQHEVAVVAPRREQALLEPVRSTRFSHSAGMIWSVSTSLRFSGTPRPGDDVD